MQANSVACGMTLWIFFNPGEICERVFGHQHETFVRHHWPIKLTAVDDLGVGYYLITVHLVFDRLPFKNVSTQVQVIRCETPCRPLLRQVQKYFPRLVDRYAVVQLMKCVAQEAGPTAGIPVRKASGQGSAVGSTVTPEPALRRA